VKTGVDGDDEERGLVRRTRRKNTATITTTPSTVPIVNAIVRRRRKGTAEIDPLPDGARSG
jgi:hypothetical protein